MSQQSTNRRTSFLDEQRRRREEDNAERTNPGHEVPADHADDNILKSDSLSRRSLGLQVISRHVTSVQDSELQRDSGDTMAGLRVSVASPRSRMNSGSFSSESADYATSLATDKLTEKNDQGS